MTAMVVGVLGAGKIFQGTVGKSFCWSPLRGSKTFKVLTKNTTVRESHAHEQRMLGVVRIWQRANPVSRLGMKNSNFWLLLLKTTR
jgi:hypothetical protein